MSNLGYIQISLKDPLSVSLFCHLTPVILCALIFSETLALYKSFTYLLTYLLTRRVLVVVVSGRSGGWAETVRWSVAVSDVDGTDGHHSPAATDARIHRLPSHRPRYTGNVTYRWRWRRTQSDVTELNWTNWHGLVSDELTNEQAGRAYWSLVGACCVVT